MNDTRPQQVTHRGARRVGSLVRTPRHPARRTHQGGCCLGAPRDRAPPRAYPLNALIFSSLLHNMCSRTHRERSIALAARRITRDRVCAQPESGNALRLLVHDKGAMRLVFTPPSTLVV